VPIPKITATQFESNIRNGITSRTTTHDTAVGPIPEVVIKPAAQVFERQNDRIRTVSLIISLSDEVVFSDEFEADLDAYVFNEGLLRALGSRATAIAVFSRAAAPTADIVVQRGFPIGTEPDEATGRTITFITSESRTLSFATASGFFNIQSQRYELSVPVIAIVEGSVGRVGASRINRPLRPLVGFDSVTNPAAAVGGRDRESNADLIERYLLAIQGRQLGTPFGIERFARDEFPDVEDLLAVFGDNVLLTRDSEDAGAVDAYIVGDQALDITDNVEFFGIGVLLPLSTPPLISVSAVSSGASTYIKDQDYEEVFDETGNAGSVRAVDGIQFLAGGPTALPAAGDVVTSTYTQNQLIRNLQTRFEQDDAFVFGRDLLFKLGVLVNVVIDADLTVETGFNASGIQASVETVVQDFINALELGEDVERSDIQGVVRQISGVDNFVFTRITRSTVASGVADIPIGDNEYARIAVADLTITV
jgi:uncharacterized phage protein gp47/JayE